MKQYNHSIGVVCCYFGQQFPDYFAYFLKSASWNPSVDFIIFSNIPAIDSCPNNVKFVQLELSEISTLASQKLGLSVVIDNPYKLSDFKPAYGLLFDTYLEPYEFWGYADIDILLGDIRHFLTDSILEAHDLISCRAEFPSGFFCLYRNNTSMRQLFMESKDWQQVFSASESLVFEECGFSYDYLKHEDGFLQEVVSPIESMADILKKHTHIRAYMQPISHQLQHRELMEVTENGIRRLGKEGVFMVVHFACLNRRPQYVYKKVTDKHSKFYADIFGIESCETNFEMTVEDRNRYLLSLKISVNYQVVEIDEQGTVNARAKTGASFCLSNIMLLNTQLLLLIHHQANGITGREVVDFFIKSKLFTIQKEVPPTAIEIEMLILNLLSRLVEYGYIIIQP